MHAEHPNSRPASSTRRLWLLSFIFFLSGICGLIYESIWSHYLKLFVGHAAYAQTVVLIVFIGGMALGAALIGRFTNRIKAPLIGYAIAEAIVGAISLLFHKGFVGATGWAYASLLPAACVPETPCFAQWIFAALLILPQSILLGTTFPLMTAGILRLAPEEPGRKIGLLYFLNSIGAAAGVLLAGFWLIPTLGLPGTLLTAGLMNLLVALGAWSCGKAVTSTSVVATRRSSPPAQHPTAFRRPLIIVAALTGLSSFIYEIIWIRMLSLVVGTSTHAFEIMLAAFIFGVAMGGLWVRNRIDRFRDLIYALAVIQVLMGVAAVATLTLYDSMFDLMSWLLATLQRSDGGYLLYNIANHAIALVIMLPATFLAGMTFPLIATALLRGEDGERALGYTYAANTLGSIFGVIVAVHLALPHFGIKGSLVFAGLIDVALGVGLLFWRREIDLRPLAFRWGAAGFVMIALVGLLAPVLPERMASGVYRTGRAKVESTSRIQFHQDGKTASVTILRSPTRTTIATNGKPDAAVAHDANRATSDEATMVMSGLVPVAYKPDAKHAAVIGFGSGITTTTLLASPFIERVDTIEIEPQMVEAARHFRPLVSPAYDDPRSRIVIDDAKSYFARSKLHYDLIVSEPSNPWVSGVASLFTQEFYARVKKQLNPGGVFVQWIHVYEFNDRLLATILRALDEEFEDYAVYAANDGDLIIAAAPETLPGGVTDHAFDWPEMRPLLKRGGIPSATDLQLRRLATKRTVRPLLAVMGTGINSDYYPVVDQHAARARFVGHAATAIMRASVAPVPILEMLGDSGPLLRATGEFAPAAPARRKFVEFANDSAIFLQSGSGRGVVPRSPELGLLRAVAFDCALLPAGVTARDLMLPLAVLANPMVPREHSSQLWTMLASSQCPHFLQPNDRDWLALFRAVSERNYPAMVREGVRIAEQERDADFLAYATMAGAAGLIASNRLDEATAFITSGSSRLPSHVVSDPVLQLLAILARTGLPKYADVASSARR